MTISKAALRTSIHSDPIILQYKQLMDLQVALLAPRGHQMRSISIFLKNQ